MKPLMYDIDLTQIRGEGDFPCPKCGVRISPEDWSDSVYEVIEAKVKNDELEELIILCNKCRSKIRLFGWLH
jgi:predicted RNA-binding Zn-ribbon protein involved in translation (DUF1610 family)